MALFAKFILLLTVIHSLLGDDCVSRDYGNGGTVCVCSSEFCDSLKPIPKTEFPNFIRYTSDQAGLRFDEQQGTFKNTTKGADNVITIGTRTYQEIHGFGGAFTDSTGINVKSLNEDLQDKILRSYFGTKGIEYNSGRVPIAGTDFSTHHYSYCDTENNQEDVDLEQFRLAPEDELYKIPLIQKANYLTNGELKLFASAWIAPYWMKTDPEASSRYAFIKERLYPVWADYFLRFLDSYQEQNITFWGITTGNEPYSGLIPAGAVPSIAWLPDQMTRWVKELGSKIRSSLYSDIKILLLDDSTLVLPWLVEFFFMDEEVKNYIDGIGVHWYADSSNDFNVIGETLELYPDKFILYTEACNGFMDNQVSLGSWQGAEDYANNIIEVLNQGGVGWTDWNMVLDLNGGPTYISNFVSAPIIVNATAGEFYKQPSFYAMGHFSKILPRGSLRLELSADINGVEATAFKRPDGGIAVTVLNKNDNEVSTTLSFPEGDINLQLTSKSLNSVLYWN